MILGIGVDIIEIARVKEKLEILAKKVLTEEEYNRYLTLNERRKEELVAGRVAAKEAVYKALPKADHFSTLTLTTIDNKLYYLEDNIKVHISISHEKDYAIAYALALEVEKC